jgi:hypothetical protein
MIRAWSSVFGATAAPSRSPSYLLYALVEWFGLECVFGTECDDNECISGGMCSDSTTRRYESLSGSHDWGADSQRVHIVAALCENAVACTDFIDNAAVPIGDENLCDCRRAHCRVHLRLPSRVHDLMPPPLTDARRWRVRTRQRAVAKAESVRLDTWQALTLAINTCYMDLSGS